MLAENARIGAAYFIIDKASMMSLQGSRRSPKVQTQAYAMQTAAPVHAAAYLREADDEAIDLTLTAAVLARLAAGGAVLKLGIGSGQLGILLTQAGLAVTAVAATRAALEQLAHNQKAAGIRAVMGDWTTINLQQRFSLVHLGDSRLYRLETQEAQVACFRNAARHLVPGGLFVVEAFIHDDSQFGHSNQAVIVRSTEGPCVMHIQRLDRVRQIITTQEIAADPDCTQLPPKRLRFVHPSEMDLMAQLAGLRLQVRWGDWRELPFTASSTRQIAVYEKPMG
jgi:SAM-dependent methyltransferase